MADVQPTLDRLEEQISWYDRKSALNQTWFKRLKLIEMLLAAGIPMTGVFATPPWVAAVLGALVLLIEGVIGLYQFSTLWPTYRATCEALKHEKYLYLAKAGPYQEVEDPTLALAERVESLVSQEHAKWVRGRLKEEDSDGVPIKQDETQPKRN